MLGQLGLPNPLQLMKGDWQALSPKQMDHLLRGYFSWLATVGTTVSDYPLRVAADRGERPDLRLKDAFFVGNFVESLPSNSSRYVSQLYEQSRDAQQALASYRDAVKDGDQERAAAIQDAHGDKLRAAPRLEHAAKWLSVLNAQARKIEADRGLSGEEKRQRLESIEARRHEAARRAAAAG